MKKIKVIGHLEIIGSCIEEKFLFLRESAEKHNKEDDGWIYAVIRNPRGKKYGYYLIREKK